MTRQSQGYHLFKWYLCALDKVPLSLDRQPGSCQDAWLGGSTVQAGFQVLGPAPPCDPAQGPDFSFLFPTVPGARAVSPEPGSIRIRALRTNSGLGQFLQAPLPAPGPSRQPHSSLGLGVWSWRPLFSTSGA